MKIKNDIIWKVCCVNEMGISLIDKIAQLSLPLRDSYERNKIITALTKQFEVISNLRNEAVKKYGKEKEDQYFIDASDMENIKKFSDEFNDVLSIEEEYKFNKISIEVLDKAGLTLDYIEMEKLKFLVDFDNEKNVEGESDL